MSAEPLATNNADITEPTDRDTTAKDTESKHDDTSNDTQAATQTDAKHQTDDDKNIHVPKDKKLKIELVSIKTPFVLQDNVFYDIHVQTAEHDWHVTKRYSQFEDLNHQLSQLCKQKLPLLPAKHYKWFTDHMKPSFIEKRRALLDNYVKKLIKAKQVSSSQCVVNFFHTDKESEEVIAQRRLEQARLAQQSPLNGPVSDGDPHSHEEHPEPDGNAPDDDHDLHNNNGNDVDTHHASSAADDEQKLNGSKKERRLSDEYEFPEDQEVTNVVIQSTRKMTDHVIYQICVSNSHKRASFRTWTVLRRFTQFYDMDSKLRTALQTDKPNVLPTLPPPPTRKLKLVHDHMDDDFIEERRVLLENYLSKLLRYPDVVSDEDFLRFVGVLEYK